MDLWKEIKLPEDECDGVADLGLIGAAHLGVLCRATMLKGVTGEATRELETVGLKKGFWGVAEEDDGNERDFVWEGFVGFDFMVSFSRNRRSSLVIAILGLISFWKGY